MNPTRQRVLAKFRNDPEVELFRAPPGIYVTEGCVRALTENMSGDWRHWIERPTPDYDAIGRMVVHAPAVGRPRNDVELEIETYEAPPRPDFAPQVVRPQAWT